MTDTILGPGPATPEKRKITHLGLVKPTITRVEISPEGTGARFSRLEGACEIAAVEYTPEGKHIIASTPKGTLLSQHAEEIRLTHNNGSTVTTLNLSKMSDEEIADRAAAEEIIYKKGKRVSFTTQPKPEDYDSASEEKRRREKDIMGESAAKHHDAVASPEEIALAKGCRQQHWTHLVPDAAAHGMGLREEREIRVCASDKANGAMIPIEDMLRQRTMDGMYVAYTGSAKRTHDNDSHVVSVIEQRLTFDDDDIKTVTTIIPAQTRVQQSIYRQSLEFALSGTDRGDRMPIGNANKKRKLAPEDVAESDDEPEPRDYTSLAQGIAGRSSGPSRSRRTFRQAY